MTTIWKFPLQITDVQLIDMPEGWPIAVAEQDGQLVMWAEVDTSTPKRQFPIRIVGTGNPFPDHGEQLHIGSVVMSNGLVWHVYAPLQREVRRGPLFPPSTQQEME